MNADAKIPMHSTGKAARDRVVPVHCAVAGRARFRVAGLHRSPIAKRILESRLAGLPAIRLISVSALTGTVLVRFDPDCSIEQISALIERALDGFGRLEIPVIPPAHVDSARAGWRWHTTKPPPHESWHAMDRSGVAQRLGTSIQTGLSGSTAAQRLQEYGANRLPESAPRPQLAILLDQLSSTPILLLMAAAGASILTGGIADAAMILGVVALNGAIGYATESQAQKTIDSLRRLVTSSATVLRDGLLREIPEYEVVVGDIMILRPGYRVAADGRLIEAERLSIDESTLTGESAPAYKTVAPLAADELPLADRRNMVYMGTLVTGGQGSAVVVATGRWTQIGRIQTLAAAAQAPRTPLQRQLDDMGRQLGAGVSAVSAALFGIGLLRGYSFINMLQTSIALAVAAVPEGLPTIATTILALGIARMRKQHVLIRRLGAVETLGCVGAVCLDKTGTLTLNRMSVVELYAGGRRFEVRADALWGEGQPLGAQAPRELAGLLRACVLCSETRIERRDGTYVLTGSPTENALVNLALALGEDALAIRRSHPILKVSLRSEDRSFMRTLHRIADGAGARRFLTAVKGSPEQVLAMCTRQLKAGRVVELTAADRAAIEAENQRMAGRALRVLGCAWREDAAEPLDGEQELVWLGLAALTDPVRSGVAEVIRGFHRAGIDTVMITGDQGPTAWAIGNELNLSRNSRLEIVDSTELAGREPDVLKGLAGKVDVFARVSPAHKLQIVRAMQRGGKIVAMTGDGINDSPALKAADIGVAMGHSGTDIAREVADVILEDDALETMLAAVRQGRTIYSNIRKAVHFLLSTNLSEVIVTFAAIAAGMGQPLTPMQLLWINLISETSLGLGLALEPPEAGIMEQPPRDPHEPVVRPADLRRMGFESLTLSAGTLGAYGYGLARHCAGARARTLGFTALVGGQILHAIPSRSERFTLFERPPGQSNPVLALMVAGSLVLQVAVFVMPWLRKLLAITAIDLADTVAIGAGSILPLLINEGAKRAVLARPTRDGGRT